MTDYTLHCGDVLDVASGLPDNTYSAVFCDPPYGIKFMSKIWDHGVPSVAVWEQVYRVCRPGAVLMAFGGTRTWHRLAVNIEDAGWQMFDTLMYVYGSGFPKGHDISKAIDKAAGAEREVIGVKRSGIGRNGRDDFDVFHSTCDESLKRVSITAPATPDAATWAGYNVALKPSYEPILCFRKPLESTYAHSALTYGTGALNIDGCRVPTNEVKSDKPYMYLGNNGNSMGAASERLRTNGGGTNHPQGRWPANLIHDGSDEVMEHFPSTSPAKAAQRGAGINGNTFFSPEYESTIRGHNDNGGSAARFFYCAKASSRERNAGLDGMEKRQKYSKDGSGNSHEIFTSESANDSEWAKKNPNLPHENHHPTVKPLALTEYLARLIVPPEAYRDDAQILIPYAGVNSEVIGAMLAGWKNITAIEKDDDYHEIGKRRLAWWKEQLEITGLSDPSAILARYGKKDKGKSDLTMHLLVENLCQSYEEGKYGEHEVFSQPELL